MKLSEILAFVVPIITALLGASGFIVYKIKNNNRQSTKKGNNVNVKVKNSDNNIISGGNVDIKTKDWK